MTKKVKIVETTPQEPAPQATVSEIVQNVKELRQKLKDKRFEMNILRKQLEECEQKLF